MEYLDPILMKNYILPAQWSWLRWPYYISVLTEAYYEETLENGGTREIMRAHQH